MANAQQTARMMDGAVAYASADKSDPFALNRALTHVKNGVASIQGDQDQFYSADQFQEERSMPDGTRYHVVAFRNIRRP